MKKEYRKNKEKKIKETMREIIEFDIDRGAFKFEKATVNFRAQGGYVLSNINQDKIVEYILMTIGEVEKLIPINYKSDFEEGKGYNRVFHDTICGIRNTYREKAEQELNDINSKQASKYSFISMIAAIVGVIITIISLFK